MNPASEELVAVVDEHNRVIGSATRGEMRRLGLWHRSTYILVFDGKGRLLVQKRTLTKDVFPGYWDPAAGGVVLSGESAELSASRELAEEMGIEGIPLEPLFGIRFERGSLRVWGRVFRCESHGPVRPQPEEVQFVEPMFPAEVLERSAVEPFTPDGLAIVRRLPPQWR